MASDFYDKSYVRTGRDGRKPRLCVSYRDADGRRRERTRAASAKGVRAQRREAEEWRLELNREREERERRAAEERAERERGERFPTVSEYVRRFTDRLALDDYEDSTLSYNEHMGRLVSDPDCGIASKRLDELCMDDLREWERRLRTVRGLSPQTVGKAHRYLKRCLESAVHADHIIAENPMGLLRPPRVRRERPNALDRRSVARVRDWLEDGEPDGLRTAVALALFAGMRCGECCALRWRDVDLAAGVIRLRRALGKRRADRGGGWYVKAPKGGRGRDIPISPALADALARRARAMMSELLEVMPEGDARAAFPELFVCGPVSGEWTSPVTISTRWGKVRAELGVRGLQRERCPFHDLRHTFITYAIYGGVPLPSVRAMAGHASMSMTLDVYASEDPRATMAAGGMIDGALPGGDEEEPEPVYTLPDGL